MSDQEHRGPVRQLMREYGGRAARARATTGAWGVWWPASFPGTSRARAAAHALAALVLVTAVCGAYIAFYWADDPQVDSRSRVGVLVAGGSMMAIPGVLTALVLLRALRDRFGALYWLLVALAWPTALVATPLLVLRTAVMDDNDYCTAWVPRHPLSGTVLPLGVLVALASGSAATWIMSMASPRRARPGTLYVVWLVTVAVTVVLTLAPQLHSARTCGSEAGARGTPGSSAGKQPW
ncbi:hypothetical protein ACWGLF_08840 [Streptomyces puniciscabiei]